MFAGHYARYLSEWLRYFTLGKDLHIVDGDNLGSRPWEEFDLVQDFLGLPRNISRDDFVYSEEKGFYCFRRKDPKAEIVCMGNNKGHHHEPDPDLEKKLTKHFREPNQNLFKMLGRKFDWKMVDGISHANSIQ